MMKLLVFVLSGAVLAVSCDSATSIDALSETQGEWQLLEFALSDGIVVQIPNPERYTVQFEVDGGINVGADCNGCSGSYETSGNSIDINIMLCTAAACPPGSFSSEYVAALDSASSFLRTSSELTLNSPGGSMNFRVSP